MKRVLLTHIHPNRLAALNRNVEFRCCRSTHPSNVFMWFLCKSVYWPPLSIVRARCGEHNKIVAPQIGARKQQYEWRCARSRNNIFVLVGRFVHFVVPMTNEISNGPPVDSLNRLLACSTCIENRKSRFPGEFKANLFVRFLMTEWNQCLGLARICK